MARIQRDPPVRPFGRHGYQMAVSFVEPHPHFGFTGEPIFGQPMGPHYLYGSFRSVEGDRFYYVIKPLYPSAAGTTILRADGDADFVPIMDVLTKSFRGDVGRGACDGGYGVWNRPIPGMAPFRFTTNGEWTHMVESDFLSLEGEVLGDTMQLVVVDAVSPLIYTSHNYRVSGSLCGEAVEGFYSHDYLHLAAGQTWFEADFMNRAEGLFAVFITTYEDGGWDKGTLIHGREGFNCALIQRSSGERIAATDVDYEWDMGPDDFVTRCVAKISEDETWEFVSRNGKGGPRAPVGPSLGDQGPGYSLEGVVTKVGESRRWVDSDANFETYPSLLEELAGDNP